MIDLYYPLKSLQEGNWFKLICGASFQHLAAVRNLTLAYALAGADCIDVAADPAVIAAAKEALETVDRLIQNVQGKEFACKGLPWLMVSLNDGEDPHFRKAEFNAANCPPDCQRPCETICPAEAIVFHPASTSSDGDVATGNFSGVLSDRCYGCGRCLPVCPIQHISTRAYVSTPTAIAPLILEAGVDAIEIHTQIGRVEDFKRLWTAILPWIGSLKLIAISCPDGDGLIDYLWALYDLIAPLPCALIWQTDGRPMSGDIGVGATRAAVKLGQKVLAAGLPGYVQLAGGTNHHTVEKLRSLGLLNPALFSDSPTHSDAVTNTAFIAGVAYGSYARTLLAPVLEKVEAFRLMSEEEVTPVLAHAVLQDRQQPVFQREEALSSNPFNHLEAYPTLLWRAVSLADSLVSQLKPPQNRQFTVYSG